MSTRVTDGKLSEAKRLRDLLEVKVEAAELQKDLTRMTKTMGQGEGDAGGMRPIDRVREAYTSGLEIKAFKDALGPSNNGESAPPSSEPSQKAVEQVSETRTRIVETLVKAGKNPKEIQEYLDQLGPALELAGLAKDPMSQLLLYSRFAGRPSEMQLKDVLETIKLVNETKGPSGGKSDAAELASAFADVFKAGREQIQQANPGMSPFESFQEGMKQMQTLMAQQNETTKTMFNERIKTLEEKISASDPIAYMKSMKEAADTMGWGGADKEIELRKLENDDKRKDRDFEREKTIWELEKIEKKEARKDKAQSQMLDRIMTGVETALESPVIKEAGKMVGSKLQGKVPDVRGQAARSQLTEPMQEVREFTCTKCQKTHQFTNADLVQIANKGGRWVCPTSGCGAAYNLPKEGGTQK